MLLGSTAAKARSPIFRPPEQGDSTIVRTIRETRSTEDGQGITEYAVMLVVILALVIGTVRLVGAHANHAFSRVVSVFQPQQNAD
jgi:Flp pilus assembly pilin Flp